MRIIIMVYSQIACKEFVLPELHNEEVCLLLKGDIFGMQKDVSLYVREEKETWFMLRKDLLDTYNEAGITHKNSYSAVDHDAESGREHWSNNLYKIEPNEICQLEKDEVYILDVGDERLTVFVRFKKTAFTDYKKYRIRKCQDLTIGSSSENMVQYSFNYNENQYIDLYAASIRGQDGNKILEVLQENARIYVNGQRINKQSTIRFGDCIQVYGLSLFFLGDIIAIRADGKLLINTSALEPYLIEEKSGEDKDDANLRNQEQIHESSMCRKRLYHRSPRRIEKLYIDTLEIDKPPAHEETKDADILMTIGPYITSTFLIFVGSNITILGFKMGDTTETPLMYMGIIIAICATLGCYFWILFYQHLNQKKIIQHKLQRNKIFREYLNSCTEKIKQIYTSNTETLRKAYPAASFCVTEEVEKQKLLWNRNRKQKDFLVHRIGVGDMPFQVMINVPKVQFNLMDDSLNKKLWLLQDSYKTLHAVPICIDLLHEKTIGIVGGRGKEGAYEVLYDLVAQISAMNCYTDVKMAFLFLDEKNNEQVRERWDFLRWLPHTWSQDHKIRYFASNQNEIIDVLYALNTILQERSEQQGKRSKTERKTIHIPHYILFVEDSTILKGELINSFFSGLDEDLGITLVILAERYEDLPDYCECIIENDDSFKGIYRTEEGIQEKIEFDILNRHDLDRFVRYLANIEVKEVEAGGDIPDSLSFFEMYGIKKPQDLDVVRRWHMNMTYVSLRAIIGHMAGGAPCYLDVHEKCHGPHGLVAGTTGSGKSETLQTYILSLAINFSPDDVGFLLIDYKGGGMANLFDDLPHMMGKISNLSSNQVSRAMISIKSESRRRQRVFSESGVNNIDAYTQLYKNGEASVPIPHLFIIIDEFAELKREQPDFMKELISVAQVGRSLGMHLILATQKPAGTVDDNIWFNSKFRLCLRVQDRQDSLDMLHKPDAAFLTQAGRCYLQVGNDELFEIFQSGWSGAVYDVMDAKAQRPLANMLTGTGKAALTGSYVKRRQKETQKEKWIAGFLEILDSCGEEKNVSGTKLGKTERPNPMNAETVPLDGTIVDRFFRQIEAEGIDYADNEFNRRAVSLLFNMNRQEAEGRAEWDRLSSMERAKILLKMESRQKGYLPKQKEQTQLDAVIEYLAKMAKEDGYTEPQKLCLPVLPSVLPLDAVLMMKDASGENPGKGWGFDGERWPVMRGKWSLSAIIGIYDDPANNAQGPLEISFTEYGNIAVCGMPGSGRSTVLQTILCSLSHRYSPKYLGFYVLDFSNRVLSCFEQDPHCGGVLYEDNIGNVEIFFNMLLDELKKRRDQFSVGNYYQYVRKYGVSLPVAVIVIDNYAGFREKTEGKYDDLMLRLTRECNACGIYFLLSATGYNKDEIPNRMRDNFHYTIALEMMDQFTYGDVFGVMRVPLMPESGIPGRGLVQVGDGILEFQTAVAVDAWDDYKRSELLREQFTIMASAWRGPAICRIPQIPAKPTWEIFKDEKVVQDLVKDGFHLPIGYIEQTAEIYGINLRETYTWLVQSKKRDECKKVLQLIAKSAALRGGIITVVEPEGTQWRTFALSENFQYLSGFDSYYEFFEKELAPDFVARNKVKNECLHNDYTDDEIYQRMARECSRYLIITDLYQYVKMFFLNDTKIVGRQMTNLFDKGFLHNIYFFAGMNPDDRKSVLDNSIFNAFITPKAGIYLGGRIIDQKIFDFSIMPFHEQAALVKEGHGVTAPTENEDWHRIVLPIA